MRRICLLALCACLMTGSLWAADTEGGEAPKWKEKLDFGGDLRLRYEGFDWTGHFDEGERNRLRLRWRVGVTAQVTKNVKLGFQLRSGNPKNPISDNQSLDNGFDKKEINIAQMYANWQATKLLNVVAGKFRPKGLWTAVDMEYDDDVVVEGAMELLNWKFDGVVKELDVNFWQFVMNESSDAIDSYAYGAQAVPVFRLGEKNTLAAGLTFQTFSNPTAVLKLYYDDKLVTDTDYITNFVDPNSQEIISDFNLGNLFLKLKNTSINRWPIQVTASYYKNFGAKDAEGALLPVPLPDSGPVTPLVTGNPKDNDTGYYARVEFGSYKKPGQVAVRVTRYHSEPDAILFAYAQSDSRRASNVDGWRTDFRIGMPMKGWINVTWYNTEWTTGEDSTMDRWQADYIFSF